MADAALHDTPGATVDGAHGPRLTSRRAAFFEWWAVNAVAEAIAEDPAVRRWLPVALQSQLTLAGRVFVRAGAEIKSCSVDLTSPVFPRILCNLVRSAARIGGSEIEATVAQMLPFQAWLTYSAGRRYCSELRTHVVDPVDPDAGGSQ
jgi:hypothetical protein